MRVPLTWLQEYCSPGIPLAELEDRLTMTGTKVEALHHHGVREEASFVVGKVLTAEQHPDADRLSVCTVDVGDGGEAKQIVCGAPNVAAGQTVAVARPGAVMPDGTKLGTAKLRGVASDGMILAEDELAIGMDHAGIMLLDDALAAGTPLAEVLPIATDVLELEITPNRPDCLGVYGVARECHAVTGAPLVPPPWADDPGTPGDPAGIEVEVRCPDLNPRFTGRVFENVTIGPSPAWLKARLMAAGQRPISNVVDITNYVMLLTGHPLHAFDLDRVEGGRLVVRRAEEGEQVETLDGVIRTLDPDVVVIEDAAGPTSIAGVMGGARSEVHENTTRVLMEAATWNGPNINRTSHRLGLRSEASARFEKQLAPEQAMEAQAVAAQLMVELCGATLLPGTVDVGVRHVTPRTLRLRDARTAALLGHAVPRTRAEAILEALGFGVTEAEDGLDVRVPYFRHQDITREADLVEEVARVDGLEKLPATLPSRRGAVGVLSPQQRARRRAEDALVGCGLHETMGWSFVAPDQNERLRVEVAPVALENPMSEEQSVMRTTLLGSLLDAALHNVRRGRDDVRLFEVGGVYRPWADGAEPAPWAWAPMPGTQGEAALRERRLPDERQSLAALLTGAMRPVSWREAKPPQADFFAVKGVLAALMDALRLDWWVNTTEAPGAFLHPGRSARVIVAGQDVGWIGELHPRVAARWDLPQAAAFELDLATVAHAATAVPEFQDLTSFPAVRQDIAVVIDRDVPADDVVRCVQEAGGSTLRAAEVFDVYSGEQVGEGNKSLALHLVFQADDRTLTEDEVTARRKKIAKALSNRLGAELRG
jgi:phenylalanyl-tRNA synthetase beta chain